MKKVSVVVGPYSCSLMSLHCVCSTRTQHYALLSVAWQKWITSQRLIGYLSQCSTYIFIHNVWHSMEESIARVLPVTDMRVTIQFSLPMYILTLMFIIFSIHHTLLWTDTLLNLDMVNWTFCALWEGCFFHLFYSWASNPAVNVFKTDSALLNSWIRMMFSIMTSGSVLWPLKNTWFSIFTNLFPVQHNTSGTLVCT